MSHELRETTQLLNVVGLPCTWTETKKVLEFEGADSPVPRDWSKPLIVIRWCRFHTIGDAFTSQRVEALRVEGLEGPKTLRIEPEITKHSRRSGVCFLPQMTRFY